MGRRWRTHATSAVVPHSGWLCFTGVPNVRLLPTQPLSKRRANVCGGETTESNRLPDWPPAAGNADILVCAVDGPDAGNICLCWIMFSRLELGYAALCPFRQYDSRQVRAIVDSRIVSLNHDSTGCSSDANDFIYDPGWCNACITFIIFIGTNL